MLVIDDEPILRMLVIDVLQENGYRAIEAVDGPSGLKMLQSDARIDLLITDVGLPGGMNGRQVADAARKTRPDLKVLFITGYAENAVIGNGHLEPGMEVLTKPFPMATLGQRITGSDRELAVLSRAIWRDSLGERRPCLNQQFTIDYRAERLPPRARCSTARSMAGGGCCRRWGS